MSAEQATRLDELMLLVAERLRSDPSYGATKLNKALFFAGESAMSSMAPKALEHAQMLIASTIASAALGSTLESSRIIRAIETDRGGKPQSALWFANAQRLPMAAAARVMCRNLKGAPFRVSVPAETLTAQ